MVDRSNLQQVNMLYGEAAAIDMALRGFDNGGRIVQMSVSPGPLPEPSDEDPFARMRVSGMPVSTVEIEYPPQMVEGIKQQLQTRKAAIDRELTELGLTGIAAQPAQPAAPAAPALAPQTRRRS